MTLLYTPRIVSLNGLTAAQRRRATKEALTEDQYPYALLQKQSITLSMEKGISVPDVLMETYHDDFYVYIEKISATEFFFLYVQQKSVVRLEVIDEMQLVKRIAAYVINNPFSNALVCYVAGIDAALFSSFIEDEKKAAEISLCYLTESPLRTSNNDRFQLRARIELKRRYQGRRHWLLMSAVVVVVMICIAYWVVHAYALENSHREKQKQHQPINRWAAYRQTIATPNAHAVASQIFDSLTAVTHETSAVVRSFHYANHELQLKLVLFDAAMAPIVQWSQAAGYHLIPSKALLLMTKVITVKTQSPAPNIIYSLLSLTAAVVDSTHALGGGFNVTVGEPISQANYQHVDMTLTVTAQPVKMVLSLLQKFTPYPILLKSIEGDVSMGNFSGTIELTIVGASS